MEAQTGPLAGMEAMQQTLNLVVQILHKQQQQADRRMALDKQMMKQQELTTQNVVHLRILKMMAEDDLETFLESFEWTVMAVGTDKSRWAAKVGVLLVCPALTEIYHASQPKTMTT